MKKNKQKNDNPETEKISGVEEQICPEKEGEKIDNFEAVSDKDKNASDELDIIKKERDDFRNKWLIAEADLENLKKRTVKDKEELRKFALEGIIRDMLTPIDYLEMATQHAKSTNNIEALVQGVEYTHKCMIDLLKNYGVEQIDSENAFFDPALHEAHSVEETETEEDGKILKQHRKAYKMFGRLLRAGIVTVAKKKEAKLENQEEAKSDEQINENTENIKEDL